jgi:hypothetical protein
VEILSNLPVIAYRVYLDDLSGNDPVLSYDTGHRSLTNLVTLNNLLVGRDYKITVRAVNEIGESVASNELEISVGIAPT